MDFRQFEKQIVKIRKMELPGQEVQFKMAPIARLHEMRATSKRVQEAKKAGVMALFYPTVDNQTNLILILRKTYHGMHLAQVGFPGGKLEHEDKSGQEAELRETEEEIGVPRKNIEILRRLSEIYVPPSNIFVRPVVGITTTTPQFVAEEKEVEELIEVDLQHFLDNRCIITDTLTTSYATKLVVPAYRLNGDRKSVV